ncbi:MAG: serine/threonine protein kinase, partial [Armatimonadetes bacterium]|nr:serine/threonine protein kinase [Armatimonadota bacterium]
MSFKAGDVVGDYEILGVLGSGGMGQVYKVRNRLTGRVEAMKVLLPNLEGDPELADRFLREIRVHAALEHPNIAALRTAQRLGKQLVMIMEFVEGTTLEELLDQGRIAVRDGVNYVCQVLAALSYAHARGIIHRDIKPANMMLTGGGVVKLMDFGIAKMAADQRLTQTGQTVGSLYYMSPEQIQGATELDARSDLYSLGVSLYEIVTGKRPFEGDSQYSIMAAHLEETPAPPLEVDPDLPPALNDIILMAINKEPAKRFQSADAFRHALESAVLGAQPAAGAAAGAPPAATVTAAAPAAPQRKPGRRLLYMV